MEYGKENKEYTCMYDTANLWNQTQQKAIFIIMQRTRDPSTVV